MLEELASEFRMRSQDVIDRVTSLAESKRITDVIDDRGKFIYITPAEAQKVPHRSLPVQLYVKASEGAATSCAGGVCVSFLVVPSACKLPLT